MAKKQIVNGQLKCSRCEQWKDTDSFYRCARMSTGYNSHCKVCDDKLCLDNRHKTPPKHGRGRSGKPGQPPKIIVDGKQLCGRCDVWKSVAEFTASSRSLTGYSYRCRNCDHETYKDFVVKDGKKEHRGQTTKEWRKNNKEHVREQKRQRRKTDTAYRVSENLRSRLPKMIRQQLKYPEKAKKGGSAVRDLGCSITELMFYLETKFQPGMTWANYGVGSGYEAWHIDHIIPLAPYDLTEPETVKRLCHFTNLQPLWALDNILKGDKIFD